MNPVEAVLRELEQLENWPQGSLWIAPDASGNAAIWRMRGPDDLLHCVGHVQGQEFSALLCDTVIADAAKHGNRL